MPNVDHIYYFIHENWVRVYFSADTDGVLSAEDLRVPCEKRGVEASRATKEKTKSKMQSGREKWEIETKEWHEEFTLMQYMHANVSVCLPNVYVSASE